MDIQTLLPFLRKINEYYPAKNNGAIYQYTKFFYPEIIDELNNYVDNEYFDSVFSKEKILVNYFS